MGAQCLIISNFDIFLKFKSECTERSRAGMNEKIAKHNESKNGDKWCSLDAGGV